MDEAVTALRDGCSVLGRNPNATKNAEIRVHSDAQEHLQNGCILGEGYVMNEDHFLPHNCRLSDGLECLMRLLGEGVKRLVNGPPSYASTASVQGLWARGAFKLTEVSLSLRVFVVAVRIDLVASSAEELGWEELGRLGEEGRGEVDCGGGRKPQLSSRRFVGELSPRRGLEASDVLRVGVVQNRGMSRSIDLGEDVYSSLRTPVEGV